MTSPPRGNTLYDLLRSPQRAFDEVVVTQHLATLDEARVRQLAANLDAYIGTNLPVAINRRNTLTDYRTNPYVLMTCGSAMRLGDPRDFANFLVNNKLYMGLETSFGKSIESIVMAMYPLGAQSGAEWADPPEKIAEFAALGGLTRQDRARARATSVWREIDRACVVEDTRYLLTIKSGPNTINDTQVNGMKDAIRDNCMAWFDVSREKFGVKSIDIVLGLTYGTAKTTNNKDNQLLAKLLECGFVEEDPVAKPGVLIHEETRTIRAYRVIGVDYWSFVGCPPTPAAGGHVFLEVLLALAIALKEVSGRHEVEDSLNERLLMLAAAIASLRFPRNSLPEWIRGHLSDAELFWLATAVTAFYDEGI